VSGLVACPFCRELFAQAEVALCPACGLALTDIAKLPPSADAEALAHEEQDEFGIPHEPQRERLSFIFLGRGRGFLALAAAVGLGAFFAPWVDMSSPEIRLLSGATLAHRAPWIWGAGVAWFVLLPLVLSRRSIVEMRGARVAAAFLSAIPVLTGVILYLTPPRARYVPIAFTWGAGLHATVALGVLALVAAIRFGGRVDDIRVERGRVAGTGQTLH
jgi:hypothetical protein